MTTYLRMLSAALACVATAANAQTPAPESEWVDLLDADLSRWEVWTGVVPEDPAATDQKAFTSGTPHGLGDPHGLFRTGTLPDGKPFLYVSGLYYGGLTTLAEHADYHLTMEFRWGEAKYAPRLTAKRDNGLLYHCYGEHGAFWEVWKRCVEMQVQETDMGDLFLLAGPRAMVPYDAERFWDPSQDARLEGPRVKRSADHESPHGHWSRLDLYVVGDRAVHVVNGHVVLALWDAQKADGERLASGHIQLQSEGAEAYYRDIRIRPLKAFPEHIAAAAQFPEDQAP